MKHFLVRSMLLLVAGCMCTLVSAQDMRVALIDFMYVPEGMASEYVAMERDIAIPIHQELVKQGKLDAWYLFSIPLPGGTNAEYHYATVRIYSSDEQLKGANNFGEAFEKVHAGMDLEAMSQTIMNTRDLVKTHRLTSWERFIASDLQQPINYLQVVYFKTPMNNWDAYEAMEKELYHPMHKRQIELGARAGWEGWWLTRPMGTSMPYTNVAVDMYTDWDQYTKQVDEDIFKTVHPTKKSEDLDKVFMNTTELVRIEDWWLVDAVVKEQ